MTAIAISHLALWNISRGGGLSFKNAPPPPVTSPPPPLPSKNAIVKAYRSWFKVSGLGRFFVSGNLGNICFYFIERAVHRQLSQMSELPAFVEEYKDSVSFFIGYLLQIVTQHFIHAVLMYGLHTINTREKYIKTLLGQFSAYGCALIGSTFLNVFLLRAGLDKTIAFFSTMVIFAFVNYFLIGWIVQRTTVSVEKKNVSVEKKKSSSKDHATKTESAKNIAVKKVRRGGGLDSSSVRWFASPLPVHNLVLNSGAPINVDDVNNDPDAFYRK